MRDDDKFALSKDPGGDPRRRSGLGFIGFWRSKHQPDLPDPRDFVDEDWDPAERARVSGYFAQGKVVASYRGFSDCRICGKNNGSTELSDGVFVWPSGFAHYIKEHSVRPPQAIVDRALSGSR